jgi:hypothetical protein
MTGRDEVSSTIGHKFVRLWANAPASVADGEQMQQWLLAQVLPREFQEERIREQALAWLKRMHEDAPTPNRLTRGHAFGCSYL